MNVPVKVGIFLGALSGVGGLGYIVQQQQQLTTNDTNNKSTEEKGESTITKVSQVLEKKGHTFPSFEENGDLATWKTIAKAYSTGTNKLQNLDITAPSSGADVSDEDARKLRTACKNAVGSESNSNTNIATLEQWCVNPITVKDLIAKHRRVLELEDSKDDDTTQWDEKTTNYVKQGAVNKMSNPTLLNTTSDKAADRKKLKTDCRAISTKLTHDKGFHDNYKQFETWCTVSK